MKAAKVCRLRELFLLEWRRDYPDDTPPVLDCVAELSRGVDEWPAAGDVYVTTAVRESLAGLQDKIVQLREELRRAEFEKRFLGSVLTVLESECDSSLAERDSGDLDQNTTKLEDKKCDRCGRVVNEFSAGLESNCLCVLTYLDKPSELTSVADLSASSLNNTDTLGKCISEINSPKFLSRISVSERRSFSERKDRDLAAQNRISASIDNVNVGEESSPVDKQSDFCFRGKLINRSTSEPDEMLKGKKAATHRSGEDDLGTRVNRTKDNFMAVTNKNIHPGDVPRHNEALTHSPVLQRNYHFLKMTEGFGLVLEDDPGNKNSKGPASENPLRHATLMSNVNCDKPDRAKNSMTDGSAGPQTSFSRENVSVIEVTRRSWNLDTGSSSPDPQPKRKSDPQKAPVPSPKPNRPMSSVIIVDTQRVDHQGTDHCVNKDLQDKDHCVNKDLQDKDHRVDTVLQDKDPRVEKDLDRDHFSKVSIKKSPVPPPVAKKPPRPGSGRSLPPTPTDPGPTPARHFQSFAVQIDSPHCSGGSDVSAAPPPPNCPVDNTRTPDDTQQTESLVHGKTLLQASASLPHDAKKNLERSKKCNSDFYNTSPITDVNSRQGVDANIASPSALRHAQGINKNNSNTDDTPRGPSEMRSFSPIPNKKGNTTTAFIGKLAENVRPSLVLGNAHQNNTEKPQYESPAAEWKPAKTPPMPPPRGQSQNSVNVVVDRAEIAEHEYQRLDSNASTETLTEFTRKQSFTSDFDIKQAVYTLDNILTSAEMESADDPKLRTKKLDYENWTINRAVTSSLTHVFDSISDDDELDVSPSSPSVTSPSEKRRGSPTGSKDSGLCDDIGVFETTHGETSYEHDFSGGRFRDLASIRQLVANDDGEDVDYNDKFKDQDCTDAPSAAAEFVFSSESGDGLDSPDLDRGRSRRDHDRSREASPQPDYSPSRPDSEKLEEVNRQSWGVKDDSCSIASSGEEEAGTVNDSSYDETDSANEGMLKMRQLLVKGVLDSEKEYLEMLSILIGYERNLEKSSQSSQPVISKEDIQNIFSNIDTIYNIHDDFVKSLQPKVSKWTHGETIGEIFKIMISSFIECGSYLNNYQKAVSTIHKCCQESEQFNLLAQEIKLSVMKQVTTLEDALFKPVQRVQRNTLVLHDLIKYTPEEHPDYEALQKALKLSQQILESFAVNIPKKQTSGENRRLVKSSFLVELVNGVRKLRYMFLFSDVLICTKRETHRNNKVSFIIKWFAPLNQMTIDTKFGYNDDLKPSIKEDIDEIKGKLRSLKKELRLELKKYDVKDKDKHRSITNLGSRAAEKMKKKISHHEAQLILACPKLPFKVALEGGKKYTLLMTTDYEREEWKETVASLSMRTNQQQQAMSSILVQDLINSVKETPQVNKIGNVLSERDEDVLTGTLNVTIHKLNGLTTQCDTYCCLEMDSFGHFFMKAKTHIAEVTNDPSWNEDFELELDGSQTIRFLCFKKEKEDQGDKLLGRGALELSKQWLKGSFQEKTVAMNELSLVISVKHTSAEKTMPRTPSRTSAAVFGVKISSCARKEGKTVPSIVTSCLQEVEKRGLDEVGIYRVSGVTSDLQTIKKLFDKNIRAGIAALSSADIHAVTGILKLYFRELPEPLFTESSYQNFVDTLKLSDEEAKAQCMLSLLHSLPDVNYYTIVSLMEHLLRVARNVGVNKMSIHNLATVFGPTLLAPASKQVSNDPMEMMCKGAEQVMLQSSVVSYLLGLAVSGRNLRRSAQ
ncbi:uncharacterized protein LOC131929110 [Physella acuta]|uniref:uncharacterized protein LOC131929110 n=1 Tax=Physella acuta TaxID=109671 RepID=UPI0027DD7122|nr:uncharacterized protein LOC131929110 [Physella acuta]